MKLSQFCCTAALAAAPAMAILAKFCPNASAPKWSEGHDIADKSCFRLGPDDQTTMRIESTPNMAGAAKYCMYLSAGSDCLCNTVTYEFDLTSNGDWTGQKSLPEGHWESARFLRESCEGTLKG